MTMVAALNRAFHEEMERDDSVIVLGEDVGADGGIFRVTDGLIDKFGKDRVWDTPLAESGIIGASLGLAVNGMRPVPELQFSGFSYQAFHQVEQHVARIRKRTQGRHGAPMVIRMPYGAGVRALEHHSESREAYYAHTPGLKVVIPSTPRKARALLVSSIRDPDPVIFMEPKRSYRSFREEIPDKEETLEIGKADRVREGDDLTLVAWGAMLQTTLQAADALSEEGTECDVLDLMTVSPLDWEAVLGSVERTGRCVVVAEAPKSFSVSSEISARLAEELFTSLLAPVARVTGYDVHPPLFAREEWYMPQKQRVLQAAKATLEYKA